MKKYLLVCLMILWFFFTAAAGSYASDVVNKKKQTELGLYITAQEAFAKWNEQSGKVKILDVRTPGEYLFVGHAAMAANVPVKFLTGEYDPQKKKPVMPDNKHFVEDVKKKFSSADTIMVMCRSGSRSAMAVNLLAKAGFKHVYNIVDGFEGDALKMTASYNNGKRVVNGWKNSGAPWTYELNPNLVYLPK